MSSNQKARGLADLVPSDVPEYAIPAWAACVMWASRTPNIVNGFQVETGLQIGATPLDRAIGDVTGFDAVVVERFVEWVNVNVWGDWDDSPDSLVTKEGGAQQ